MASGSARASAERAEPRPEVPRAPRTDLVHRRCRPRRSALLNEQLLRLARRTSRCTPSCCGSWSGGARRWAPKGGIDWAHAEALAFASLLLEGVPIRLTGQDTERGTFSQRHLVLHDVKTGARYAPLQHLPGALAPFELHNSPLSEFAALGFEYGYSAQAPEALVLWEAQFGDFANGAQIVLDQFVASGLLQVGRSARGSSCCCRTASRARGPSTRARGSSGSSSWRARTTSASPTAPRRRSTSTCCGGRRKLADVRPLVVFTPKSFLRHPAGDLGAGGPRRRRLPPVLDDPAAAPRRGRR